VEPGFWSARWREGLIGFHLDHVNPHLERHAGALPPPPSRVLVPLAGKSLDVAWLAERCHPVTAVELVPEAIAAFFAERGLTASVSTLGPHRVHEAGRVRFVEASVFDLAPGALGDFDAVWDRAALIALPPADRARYAPWVLEQLAPGGLILAVTLDRGDPERGPPFTVTDDEVRRLWPGTIVEGHERHEGAPASPGLAAAGAPAVIETVHRLRRPASR
jgi:thiopurine S-methyltransferase